MIVIEKNTEVVDIPRGLGYVAVNPVEGGITPEEAREIAEEVVESALTDYETSEEIDQRFAEESARTEDAYAKKSELEGFATEEYVNSAVSEAKEWVEENYQSKEEFESWKSEDYEPAISEIQSGLTQAGEDIQDINERMSGLTTSGEVQDIVTSALGAYTKTEDFATINGFEITNGGDIEITGKTKYVLNETTVDVRMEIFDVLYNEPSYFQESEYYYLFDDNKYIRLTSVKIEENQLLFWGINISNFDYTEQFFVRIYPDGNFLWSKERILNDSNFATINGSKITNGGNIEISARKPFYVLNDMTQAERVTLHQEISGLTEEEIAENYDIRYRLTQGINSDNNFVTLNSIAKYRDQILFRGECYAMDGGANGSFTYLFLIQLKGTGAITEGIDKYANTLCVNINQNTSAITYNDSIYNDYFERITGGNCPVSVALPGVFVAQGKLSKENNTNYLYCDFTINEIEYEAKWQLQKNSTPIYWRAKNNVTSSYIRNIWKGTQAQYEELGTYSDSTFYVIIEN